MSSRSDYRDRMREARLVAGLSQPELAKRISISASTVSAIERHVSHVSAPTLFAWADACGVRVSELRRPS